MLLCSIAINLFYEPYDIVTSGSTGIAMLANNYLNIDLSLIVFTILSITLVLGFGIFGFEKGFNNLFGTLFYPIFIRATSLLINIIEFDDISLLFLVIVGGTLFGIGFGIIRRSEYTLGGFDILYDFIHEKFKISIGKASLICNGIIIILSFLVFGIDKCIYAIIALYISSSVADHIMLGVSTNKAFYIITKKPLEVKEYIIENLNNTVTVVNARGGYSDKKKKMLICVIPTIYYNRVKDTILEIDKSAFFLITDTYQMIKAR